MRQIDEHRLLIIFYVQVPFWAKGKMIPINEEIFPISKGIPLDNEKLIYFYKNFPFTFIYFYNKQLL